MNTTSTANSTITIMHHEDTPPATVLKEFFLLHKEEELIRLAYRARKRHLDWLSEIILNEIRVRTFE